MRNLKFDGKNEIEIEAGGMILRVYTSKEDGNVRIAIAAVNLSLVSNPVTHQIDAVKGKHSILCIGNTNAI